MKAAAKTLQAIFLPWLDIGRRRYRLRHGTLLGYQVGNPPKGISSTEASLFEHALSVFRGRGGTDLTNVALFKRNGAQAFDTVEEVAASEVFRELELLKFSALLERDLLRPGWRGYCNSDGFMVRSARCPSVATGMVFEYRRAIGRAIDLGPVTDHQVHVWPHVDAPQDLSAGVSMLRSIWAYIDNQGAKRANKVLDAAYCYGEANTDSDLASRFAEFVMLSSAFESFVDAGSVSAEVFAKKAATFLPISGGKGRSEFEREMDGKAYRAVASGPEISYRNVMEIWLREFHTIRGIVAHGHRRAQLPRKTTWTPGEHLAIARVVFPLVVKVALSRAGVRVLSRRERVEVRAIPAIVAQEDPGFGDRNGYAQKILDEIESRASRDGKVRFMREVRRRERVADASGGD